MYDVAIIGSGLVGLSFALDLARRNPRLQIMICDERPAKLEFKPEFDSRVYAISPKNYSYLQELGVTLTTSRVGSIERMQVYGDHSGNMVFDKYFAQVAYLAKIVEATNLQAALLHQVADLPNVHLHYAAISDLANYSDRVEFSDYNRSTFQAKWLIAADGGQSFIRQALNFTVNTIDYGQAGVVANFKLSQPHLNTAYQWFLGDSILALLPLPDNCVSMVWSTAHSQQLCNLSAAELSAQVTAASGQVLGDLELITPAKAFPLKLNLVNKVFDQRVILIGDAAHTIHPLAGQGVNLGFGDAWELAKLFATALPHEVSYGELNRYNYNRLAEVRQMQLTCHGLERLFASSNPMLNLARNWGMRVVDKLPPLKQLLTNQAINY
jgi:ubiquinone biosynthesis UbiH/UbiF/VisC/COQ6 family hydroxylase